MADFKKFVLSLQTICKIAEGSIDQTCIISGCFKGADLVCPAHLAEFGPSILEEAKLWLFAYRCNQNGTKFKDFFKMAKEVKGWTDSHSREKALFMAKEKWPNINSEIFEGILSF